MSDCLYICVCELCMYAVALRLCARHIAKDVFLFYVRIHVLRLCMMYAGVLCVCVFSQLCTW